MRVGNLHPISKPGRLKMLGIILIIAGGEVQHFIGTAGAYHLDGLNEGSIPLQFILGISRVKTMHKNAVVKTMCVKNPVFLYRGKRRRKHKAGVFHRFQMHAGDIVYRDAETDASILLCIHRAAYAERLHSNKIVVDQQSIRRLCNMRRRRICSRPNEFFTMLILERQFPEGLLVFPDVTHAGLAVFKQNRQTALCRKAKADQAAFNNGQLHIYPPLDERPCPCGQEQGLRLFYCFQELFFTWQTGCCTIRWPA